MFLNNLTNGNGHAFFPPFKFVYLRALSQQGGVEKLIKTVRVHQI